MGTAEFSKVANQISRQWNLLIRQQSTLFAAKFFSNVTEVEFLALFRFRLWAGKLCAAHHASA